LAYIFAVEFDDRATASIEMPTRSAVAINVWRGVWYL